MSRRRRTPEQIIRKLAEGQKLLAGGMTDEEVCRYRAFVQEVARLCRADAAFRRTRLVRLARRQGSAFAIRAAAAATTATSPATAAIFTATTAAPVCPGHGHILLHAIHSIYLSCDAPSP